MKVCIPITYNNNMSIYFDGKNITGISASKEISENGKFWRIHWNNHYCDIIDSNCTKLDRRALALSHDLVVQSLKWRQWKERKNLKNNQE
jgi:hypothetical protein